MFPDSPQQSGGRILIADDDPAFLKLTHTHLQRAGFECVEACDAASATALLDEEDFDLLISDIRMPGNDNLEFIQQIRNHTEHLPVILVTAYPSLESAVESVRLQIVAYLIKPFSYSQLIDEVNSAIGMRRLFQAVRRLRTRVENWDLSLEHLQPQSPSFEKQPMPALPLNWARKPSAPERVCDRGLFSEPDVPEYPQFPHGHSQPDGPHLRRTKSRRSLPPLDCPRLALLMDSLVETIEVLEKTKGAFRSKDLGNLRKKLETIVNSTKGLTGNGPLP